MAKQSFPPQPLPVVSALDLSPTQLRAEDMCSGRGKRSAPTTGKSEAEMSALLLELAASNDLVAFRRAVEEDGYPLDGAAPWYGRSLGGSRGMVMGFQQRTPLMIAALYGCTEVIEYVLSVLPAEPARCAVSDGATALHCAASGGSPSSLDAVMLLVGASADLVDALDAKGNRPGDVIARQFSSAIAKSLEVILKAPSCPRVSSPRKEEQVKQVEKKEYPLDLTLPDINTGIYGTDDFRMYTFKVKPCSRAYSHDWTECPFVHPGENARRRDPRKYSYTCVPCPEFRKGSCRNGDACEYAHGVFESWLHPAQYRTRLCKDETGCNRRVCFFAHKREELRAVNPSAASVAGTVLSSPRSSPPALSSLDMATALMLMQQPGSPMSPSVSSGLGTTAPWMSQTNNMTPPSDLQLSSSRLKASLSARNLDFDLDLLGLEGYKQILVDEITKTTSPQANWGAKAPEFSDFPVDPSLLPKLKGLSLRHTGPQLQSPSGVQMHQSQLLSGFGSSLSSSPTVSAVSTFDHSMAKAIMNSRASAFAKRSQSFCDRGPTASRQSTLSAMSTAVMTTPRPATLSDWGSPDGKLDWGIHGEELNKLRKSVSFAHRGNQGTPIGVATAAAAAGVNEPDLSWVHSLVKDGPVATGRQLGAGYQRNGYQANQDIYAPWAEEHMVT